MPPAVAPPRPPGTDIIIKQVLAPLPSLRVTEKCDTEQLVQRYALFTP